MTRFYGEIGFATTQESAPGVYSEVITEYPYYGDVFRNTRQLNQGENLNDDLSVDNTISVVADAYANENFIAIRYIRWMGTLWKVNKVEVQRPRLILRLGGVYSGPTGTPSDSP